MFPSVRFLTAALTLVAALSAVHPAAAQQYLIAGINTQIRDVTADGSLSITAKNARRSDTVTITVFGRHLPATNST